jgi:hypothetical protein
MSNALTTLAQSDAIHRNICSFALARGWGQYRKDTLIARFGGDVPDVRHLIAKCPRKDAPGAACYADLRERSD